MIRYPRICALEFKTIHGITQLRYLYILNGILQNSNTVAYHVVDEILL